jgi:hypothetical protein
VDRRRLLLGDWTPWLRDGIDLLRLGLGLGAAGFAAAGDGGAAAVLGVFCGLTLFARLVNLPRVYDLSFVLAMSLQAWGEVLGGFDALPWFDNVVHVSVPLLTAPVVYLALARLEVLPDPKDETHLQHYLGMFIVTLSLGLAVGALWEIVEWTSDGVLGSNLSEDNDDTVTDLIFDTTGSLVGATLLVVWARYGWGSVRRLPGENRFEDVSA